MGFGIVPEPCGFAFILVITTFIAALDITLTMVTTFTVGVKLSL